MADPDVIPLQAGDFVWYVRPGPTPLVLPAKLLSDGICEKDRAGKQYAHLAYGTANPTHELLGHTSAPVIRNDPDDLARAVQERQTHETTAPWDPLGGPGTWHLDGEAEQLEHPKRASAKDVQSP